MKRLFIVISLVSVVFAVNATAGPSAKFAAVYGDGGPYVVSMAVITDVGAETDIHPKQKGPVGTRLAKAARALAYGEDLEYSGPAYAGMEISGNRAVLNFDHLGGGLVVKGDDLSGFTIASADCQFVNAEAQIEGDRVVVHSPQVEKPVAVRYGWANYPTGNLWNRAGLPASPFRTDDFPLTTQPK